MESASMLRIFKEHLNICLYILLCIIAIVICLGSHLSPISHLPPTTDEAVWLYIGKEMQHGLIPYSDIFDHKGLLLYAIYYLGLVIGNGECWGVWIFVVIAMIISAIFLYKTAFTITSSDILSFLAAFLTLSVFGSIVYMAGLKETFALPFTIVSLYFVIEYIKSKKITWWKLLIIGFSCGCVLMITPTLATLWVVVFPLLLITAIRSKERINTIFLKSTYVLGGLLLAFIPHLIYLICTHSLVDFINYYILFDFIYSNNFTPYLGNKITLLRAIITNGVFIFAELSMLFLLFSKDRQVQKITLFSLVYYIVTLLITVGIGGGFDHYIITCIPCLCVPIAFGILHLNHIVNLITSKTAKQYLILLFAVCLIGVGGMGCAIYHVYEVSHNTVDEETSDMIKLIQNNTNENDTIQVFGNHNYIYLASNRTAASRFSYLPPIYNIFSEGIMSDINANKPNIIIYSLDRNIAIDGLNEYIQNNYRLLHTYENYLLFMKSNAQ